MPFAALRLRFAPPAARPPAVPRRRAAKRAVLAGLLAIVGVQLGLGLLSEVYPRIRDPFYGDKRAKLAALVADRPPGPRVVMLGTSRAGLGFHGCRVEERLRANGLDATAFNFGIPASGPVSHLIVLRRLLADGPAPDVVLVELLPSMLAEQPGGPVEHFWVTGDRLTYSELELVVRHGYDPAAVRRQWAWATLVPWHALRFQLLGRVVQSWIPWHLRYDWSRGADANGWGTPGRDAATADERFFGFQRARLEYGPVLEHWSPGGGAASALWELLAVCRERGVPVGVVLMPEGSDFRGLYPPAVRAKLDAFVGGLGVPVVDAREWIPDGQFTDGHHLLRPGAEAFSDRLTDEVLLPWLRR